MRVKIGAVIVAAILVVLGATQVFSAYITTLPNMPTTSKLGWKWCGVRTIAVDSAAATRNIVVFTAPCNGKIRGVQFTADAAVTGRATNYRKYIVRVTNAAGTATTVTDGSVAWSAGVTATAYVPVALYEPTLTTPTAIVRGGAVVVQDSLVGSLGHVISAGLIEVVFEGTN